MEQLVLLEFGPNGARATVTNAPSADRGLARERPGGESPILPAAAICSTAVQIEGPISPGRPICFCPTAKVHSCLLAAAARAPEAASQMSHALGSFLPAVLTFVFLFFFFSFPGANRSLVIPSFMADESGLSEAERHLLGEC